MNLFCKIIMIINQLRITGLRGNINLTCWNIEMEFGFKLIEKYSILNKNPLAFNMPFYGKHNNREKIAIW